VDEAEEKTAAVPASVNLADISLDMDDVGAPEALPVAAEKSEHWHEVATKLDLAKAYQEMGDAVVHVKFSMKSCWRATRRSSRRPVAHQSIGLIGSINATAAHTELPFFLE